MKSSFLYLLLASVLLFSGRAYADWSFYEKTTIKGTVSGTVQKGRVFEMQSGSIYEITGLVLDLVLEIMPDVTVLRDGDTFKLIVKGIKEPLICKQLVAPPGLSNRKKPASPSQSSDAVKSLPDIPLEKIIPEAQQKEMGLQKLSDEERNKLRLHILQLCASAYEVGAKQSANSNPVSESAGSSDVIESQLEGDSEGFSGDTIFILTNGQVWKQTEYYYHYHYAYRPRVLIYSDGGGYKIKIDGTDRAVGVKRIK